MAEQTIAQRKRCTEEIGVLILWGVLVLALLIVLGGCKIITKNQGEAGFRWGTEVTFFSRSAQTSPEAATIETQSQPLNAWLERKAEEPPPVEAVVPADGP